MPAPVFDQLVSRSAASGVLPPAEVAPLVRATAASSIAMNLFRQVNMGTLQTRVPVITGLGEAYWVNGDTGLKQTTKLDFGSAVLTAEEIAVLVPIPNSVLQDASIDLWTAIRPELAARFGRVIDLAVLAGINRPATFAQALIPAAIAAGNNVEAGSTAAQGGIVADLGATFSKVEADGFDVTGIAANRPLRAALRGARDTTGRPLTDPATGLSTVEGVAISWAPGGALDGNLALVGDYRAAVLGVRQDISYDLSTDGVISDENGKIILNGLTQDTTIMRAVMRVGFTTAVPATDEGAVNPFPFAVLEPTA